MGHYQLLTVDRGNPKTAKGIGSGYRTAVMHLAPHKLGGRTTVCPHATPGCIAACLNLAGRGGIFKAGERTNPIQEARKRRTRLFHENRVVFKEKLQSEIARFTRSCERSGDRPAIRLNGTSDLNWIPIVEEYGKGSGIQFYDYTKSLDYALAVKATIPENLYSVTYSHAEGRDLDTLSAISMGIRVAFVARGKTYQDREKIVRDWITAHASKTIGDSLTYCDGDAHDLIFRHSQIIILKAKGPAKRDTRGFVLAA